jgi:predicted dithiol-disulfide oxidoreductase (DUF899 family)
MGVTFPGESAEYRAARERLLEDEIEHRRMTERVAAARRALPPGGPVPQDYLFQGAVPGGEPSALRLSELFEPGIDSLAVYHWMFPRHRGDERPAPPTGPLAELPLEQTPCPSCTALLDQLDGAAEHVGQSMGLAIVAGVPIERMLAVAEDRGWRRLQLLSSAGNTFRRDYRGETESGDPMPMLNVFHRDPDGTIRLSWSAELLYAPTDEGQDPRHVGTLEPLWNLFDLTPEGRPADWHEQLHYA